MNENFEENEKKRIRDLILDMTDRIPKKALDGGHNMSVRFKTSAINARSIAEKKHSSLEMLNLAYQAIRGFYE